MKRHWNYLLYVLRHKVYVFQECLKYGLLWQGLIHDWSKLLPSEWLPYSDYYYGGYGENPPPEVMAACDVAFNHHQKRQPHHWQYWVMLTDDGTPETLPIPDRYRKEMLADWRGTGRTTEGYTDTRTWYLENAAKIRLHPETRAWVERELNVSAARRVERGESETQTA